MVALLALLHAAEHTGWKRNAFQQVILRKRSWGVVGRKRKWRNDKGKVHSGV